MAHRAPKGGGAEVDIGAPSSHWGGRKVGAVGVTGDDWRAAERTRLGGAGSQLAAAVGELGVRELRAGEESARGGAQPAYALGGVGSGLATPGAGGAPATGGVTAGGVT